MFGWLRNRWKQYQQNRSKFGTAGDPQTGDYEHFPGIISTAKPNTAEAEHRKHDRLYKDRQTITNVLIALFTAVTAGVAVWQGLLTRQALEKNEESSAAATNQIWRAIDNLNWQGRSAASSLKAAEVERQTSQRESTLALDAATNSLRTDQRAWLSVGSTPHGAVVFQQGKKLDPNLTVVNSGKTPALKVWSRFRATEVLVSVIPNFTRELKRVPGMKQIFGPGFSAPLTLESNTAVVPQSTFDEVAVRQTHRLFVYGRVDYIDAFGSRHWLAFSYVYNPVTGNLDPYRSEIDSELR